MPTPADTLTTSSNSGMCIVRVCVLSIGTVPFKHADSLSPMVTQSPVMMGGVNVAAAVAIPVVLVLLLVLIGAVVGLYLYCQNKGTE